jgi:hypothetical protein
MSSPEQIVISASRRTDIPAFYMDWFMDRIAAGFFDVVNPYNGQVRRVPADAGRVHTIVFWSKNFGRFIAGGYGERLKAAGYHLFFNFTINSRDKLLEPNLPPLDERLDQLHRLADRFEARRIHWRFDPICFYSFRGGEQKDNLGDFKTIAAAAAAAGIPTCITSFMDFYKKIERRAADIPGFSFIDPGPGEKASKLKRMEAVLGSQGIALKACCEKALLQALPPESTVSASACVPGAQFMTMDGGRVSLKKDAGQRRSAGCGCTVSMDIGGYREQPCFHNCLFCYANPASDQSGRQQP